MRYEDLLSTIPEKNLILHVFQAVEIKFVRRNGIFSLRFSLSSRDRTVTFTMRSIATNCYDGKYIMRLISAEKKVYHRFTLRSPHVCII